jgi:hypothetical protein
VVRATASNHEHRGHSVPGKRLVRDADIKSTCVRWRRSNHAARGHFVYFATSHQTAGIEE